MTSRQRQSRRGFLRAGLRVGVGAGMGALAGPSLLAGALYPHPARSQPSAATITTTDLGGLYCLQGAGCNVLAMPGDDGALMIDGGLATQANALLAQVLEATGNERIHTLINTHWHPEQVGANEAVGRMGGRIFAHEKTAMFLSNTVASVTFEGRREPLPNAAIPTETTRGDGTLEFAGQRIDYGYMPAAHTDGDLFFHFPGANVLVTGGVVSADHWPLIDHRAGAWYGGRVRAMQWLADIVDAESQVVPAHGPLMTGTDIVRQRDIHLELFETMIGYMNKGFGPEDAVANNPLQAYEAEFGDPSRFLQTAYRSMLIAYVPE